MDMPLDLLVVSVSRQGGGCSVIGFGADGFKRLVAPTPDGILHSQHYRIQELVVPRPWDRIRVEAPWQDSRPTQPENMVLDHTSWELLERPASRPYVEALERQPLVRGPLFGTAGRSIRSNGLVGTASVLYVEPSEAQAVCEWDAERERYRARLRFTCDGLGYDLPLADWRFANVLRQRGEGVYELAQIGCRAPHGLRFIVTLGEPFHGWCYKIVTGILPRRTITLRGNACSSPFPSPIRYAPDCALEHPRAFVVGA
jgi:hypothetical protein